MVACEKKSVFLHFEKKRKSRPMKRLTCWLIALLCTVNIVVAQKNITIKGTMVNGAGKIIELYNYSDKISCYEVLLDKQIVGEDQTFSLECYARYPMLVFLQIENYSQSFYVEPGREYNIYIPRFDWNIDEAKNVFLDPVVLPLEFLNLPANDINALIDKFDATVAQYIDDNRVHFDYRYRPQRQYFDSLVNVVNQQCPDVEGCDFYNRYKVYTLAQLKLNLKFDTRKHIYDQYIKGKPVLVYDENYMSLFVTLYANAISKGTHDITIHQLANWVYNLDLDTYIDSIGTDPLLRHEQVRELAALLALKESYHNFRYYDSKMVIKMIERIGQRTKFSGHQQIAENIVAGFQQTTAGSEVKPFLLPNVDKELVSLDSFKGKWVYLSFVRVGDPASQGEIETIAHFKDTIYAHNSNVAFVTIDCDREFQKMYHFLKNTKKGERYNWTWLHFNNNFDLLNNFRVVTYPTFVLINPEGKLQYDITPSPSSGFLLSPPWQQRQQSQRQDDDNPLFRR